MGYSNNSINIETIILFLAEIYGERFFIGIHKLICQTSPEFFSFVGMLGLILCFSIVKKSNKIPSKN